MQSARHKTFNTTVLLLFVGRFSTAFIEGNAALSQGCRSQATPCQRFAASGSLDLTEPLILDPKKGSFLLPIFPLRKRVRFPTDELTLNLYEERYLAMSEYILFPDSTTQNFEIETTATRLSAIAPFFGALYSSDKPQIITRGGTAPIVPVLQSGDIGVLCLVLNWMDGMIPMRGSKEKTSGDISDDDVVQRQSGVGNNSRRRIRLNALAVGRFRIDTIVHDGTVSDGKPPFMLVEASLVIDDFEDQFDGLQFDRLKRELQRTWQVSSDLEGQSKQRDSNKVVTRIKSLLVFGDDGLENQTRELESFQAASIFTSPSGSSSPKDMISLLKTRSLQTRMNILKFYKRW
ncbi:ATP-dependent protease La LON substrate-binding domain containing protein [Nitzschia inconspicua]|uniref:ATP-dependent protease La LON substrate-binding domain containing protein n=1 Tax=Nitzschia inconspicua TaxID=303405 RepID=A0A9K3PNZ8_9STRA|nr:ATP-dependent protease La LON substrate-binding domain containing protein [Nitzschia inconspicua]